MAKEDVKLIGAWPSPYVLRARIALNVKSVEYEFLEETFGVKSELLLKSNPVHKKIPVLIHQGKPICESLIIVEYIDEVWSSGPSILPSGPFDRATARFWGSYVDEKFFPTVKGIHTAPDEATKKAVEKQIVQHFDALEDAYTKLSNGGPFFGGNHIGYLDIALGCFLGWIRAMFKLDGLNLLDPSRVPGLVKWADTFSSDPAVRDLMPDADRLVEFSKMIQQNIKAAGPPK